MIWCVLLPQHSILHDLFTWKRSTCSNNSGTHCIYYSLIDEIDESFSFAIGNSLKVFCFDFIYGQTKSHWCSFIQPLQIQIKFYCVSLLQVPLTEPEADAVKAAGVRIVGIGVTAFIDEDQLRRIATTPNDVITTPDFRSLAGRVNDIIGVACAPAVAPTPAPTGEWLIPGIKVNFYNNLTKTWIEHGKQRL